MRGHLLILWGSPPFFVTSKGGISLQRKSLPTGEGGISGHPTGFSDLNIEALRQSR